MSVPSLLVGHPHIPLPSNNVLPLPGCVPQRARRRRRRARGAGWARRARAGAGAARRPTRAPRTRPRTWRATRTRSRTRTRTRTLTTRASAHAPLGTTRLYSTLCLYYKLFLLFLVIQIGTTVSWRLVLATRRDAPRCDRMLNLAAADWGALQQIERTMKCMP